MKKRLRKKKHLKEFQELGFTAKYTARGDLSEEEKDDLLWAFLEHAIEANNLLAGGGGGNSVELFVTTAKIRGSVTEEQRMAVLEWLKGEPRIASFGVGRLMDAWY
jgi:uncharacterized protein